MKNQRGISGTSLLLVILLVALMCVGTLVIVAKTSKADPDEIQRLAEVAKPSAVATAAVVEQLKQTPNPSVWQLVDLQVRVKDILAVETSRRVTGGPTLQPVVPRQELPRMVAEDQRLPWWVWTVLVIGAALLGLAMLIRLYGALGKPKAH